MLINVLHFTVAYYLHLILQFCCMEMKVAALFVLCANQLLFNYFQMSGCQGDAKAEKSIDNILEVEHEFGTDSWSQDPALASI